MKKPKNDNNPLMGNWANQNKLNNTRKPKKDKIYISLKWNFQIQKYFRDK